MAIAGFDHIALPTANTERFLSFYKALGFGTEHEQEWRRGDYPIVSITFGDNKINVHTEALVPLRGSPQYLRGPTAEPGCGDLCFVWEGGIDALLRRLQETGTEPIEGPVERIGGRGAGSGRGVSVYLRDPDQNLLEFISYDPADLERYAAGDSRGLGSSRS
ncbi:MAG: VOC family protein [Proteobacteria bacterium]|nr:VOC family protein [Pseudomonadota bacterium]